MRALGGVISLLTDETTEIGESTKSRTSALHTPPVSGLRDRLVGPTGRAVATTAWLAGLLLASTAAAQSTSPSYRLQATTLNSGGAIATSLTLGGEGSLGQDSPVGASSSFDYIVQSGFWSFLGSSVVPVVLSVGKDSGDPGAVKLAWSGNNPPYSIYRAATPATIFGSMAFAMTYSNARTDPAPPVTSLVCYSVLAEAPGPLPPPQIGVAP